MTIPSDQQRPTSNTNSNLPLMDRSQRPSSPSRNSSTSSLTSSLTSDPSLARMMTSTNLTSRSHIKLPTSSITIPEQQELPLLSQSQNTHTDHEPSSLYDSARVTDWRKVQSLAISHPKYASYTCSEGFTALHHVCTRRCPIPSVFSHLIQAFPRALIMKDEAKGWTPLHHACRFKCNREAVALLLGSFVEYGRFAARVRDKERGRMPLYYAIRYDAPDGVVELLLKNMTRADILDCDRDGVSVLGLIWDRWAASYEGKRVLGYFVKIMEQWKELYDAADNQEQQVQAWQKITLQAADLRNGMKGKVKLKWEQVNMILKGAFKYDDAEHANCDCPRTWRILHAVLSIKCHSSLFMMATVLHPEQIRELDHNDLFAEESGLRHGTFNTTSPQRPQSAIHETVETQPIAQTALHLACKSPVNGSEIKIIFKYLISLHKDAAKFFNPRDGSLPLHHLCENESKQHWVQDGIRLVYEAYPEAATVQDVDGKTPLHRAATLHESSPYFVPPPSTFIGSPIRTMSRSTTGSLEETTGTIIPNTPVRSTASAAGTRSTAGSTESRIASVEDSIGSIIQNILSIHPEVAAIPDVQGKLLMHSIAECAENWDRNVQAVYDAYPEALSRREISSRSLPLHLVASNLDAKPHLIQKIIEFHPRAASLVNGDGKLPLHLACEVGKDWLSGLEDIYEAYQNANRVVEDNERRWMPLHFVAASPYSSYNLVEKILGLAPDVADIHDHFGRTPFHIAVESGKDWDEGGIEALFNANPEAIDAPDAEGKIPLVTALLSFTNAPAAPVAVSNESVQVEGNTRSVQEALEPVDEFTTITHNTIPPQDNDGSIELENDVTQLNIVYQLLKRAPQVLATAKEIP